MHSENDKPTQDSAIEIDDATLDGVAGAGEARDKKLKDAKAFELLEFTLKTENQTTRGPLKR